MPRSRNSDSSPQRHPETRVVGLNLGALVHRCSPSNIFTTFRGLSEMESPRLLASQTTVHYDEEARVSGYLKLHVLASPLAYVILDLVAKHLLQSSSPQSYVFEGEALQYHEYVSIDDPMREARRGLANMCLVHSSWLAPAQRMLQRKLVIRSYRGIDALISSEYLVEWTRSLIFKMSFRERKIRPLVNLLACTSGLRLLSIDLKYSEQMEEDVLSAEMTSLACTIGQLKCLEGLMIFNLSAPVSRALLKPILFTIRSLRELKYVGLGFHSLGGVEEPPIVTFSEKEFGEYYNPPKLSTFVVWTGLLDIPAIFVDGHRAYIPGSGPDVFELKPHNAAGYKGLRLTLLANAFMEILRAKRFFVRALKMEEKLSPVIEELFVMFPLYAKHPPDSQLSQLLSDSLPRLRSVTIVYFSSLRGGDNFPISEALCMARNCSLKTVEYRGGSRMDELLFNSRSMEY